MLCRKHTKTGKDIINPEKRLCEGRAENNEVDEQLSAENIGRRKPLMMEEKLAKQGVITFLNV